MASNPYLIVSFGNGKDNLSTVGYQLFNVNGSPNGTRLTAGIQVLGQGQYGAQVSLPSGFRGRIQWDTGEQVPAIVSASVNPEEFEAINLLPTIGDGAVMVTQDYGGPGSMTTEDPNGVPIQGASVRAYLSSDYAAGHTAEAYIKGQTFTDINGNWSKPLMLAPGTYTIVFYKLNEFGPNVTTIVVS
jgi:hypothetical protein